jgi:SAM-dependent methyltransferase
MNGSALRKLKLMCYHWIVQVVDPIRGLRGIGAYPRYLADWWRYAHLPGAERIRLVDTYPQLHDRTDTSSIDAHYFYVNGWAMRRIVGEHPAAHVDVASQVIFANLLAAVVPTTFVDFRPLRANLDGLTCVGGNILSLPFGDGSIESISCLHVAEHIGLGRYGGGLDPLGTVKAAQELARVLAKGGNLYFALPIGKPRLCFNGHRIHAPSAIDEYFPALTRVELSGVHDDGRFVERVSPDEFRLSDYACGMFWYKKH